MNILVNASQAIEGQGEIRIRTWEQDGTVRIAFSDNGKGIPPEILPKVFDPGFTTKKAGLGTGLGLSICYRIIQDHGGRIEVESEVGRGTTFTIILPISRLPKGLLMDSDNYRPTILILDDEEMVTTSLRNLFRLQTNYHDHRVFLAGGSPGRSSRKDPWIWSFPTT